MQPGYTKILTHPEAIRSIAVDLTNKHIFFVSSRGIHIHRSSHTWVISSGDRYSAVTYTPGHNLYLSGNDLKLLYMISYDNLDEDPTNIFKYQHFSRLPKGSNSIFQDGKSMYITSDDRVIKISLIDYSYEHIAGNSFSIVYRGNIDGHIAKSRFDKLRGIAIHDGIIYLCDYLNNRIRTIIDDNVSTFDIYYLLPDGSKIQTGFYGGCTHIGFTPRGNMVLTNKYYLIIIDTKSHVILIKHPFHKVKATSMLVDSFGKIYVSLMDKTIGICTLYQVNPSWIITRLLWIAHIKSNSIDCPLSSLPRDIIKEICTYLLF